MSYEVMKFQFCILKIVRMHVEFMFNDLLTVNPLFLTLPGVGCSIVNLSATCHVESLTWPVAFQLCILKTVRMHVEFTLLSG